MRAGTDVGAETVQGCSGSFGFSSEPDLLS